MNVTAITTRVAIALIGAATFAGVYAATTPDQAPAETAPVVQVVQPEPQPVELPVAR